MDAQQFNVQNGGGDSPNTVDEEKRLSLTSSSIHAARAVRTGHPIGMTVAALLFILSGGATGLGAFLVVKRITVGHIDDCQDCWRINPKVWNAIMAFYGALLGAASATLLRLLVRLIAQRQLVTGSGVTLRMFRRLDLLDIFHVARSGKHALQRAWALPLLIVTFLSSTITVAMLGTTTEIGTVKNPYGSAAASLLNESLFYTDPNGAMFPDEADVDYSNFDGPIIKVATIATLTDLCQYDQFYAQDHDLYLGGRIGNSTYDDLDTGGIGVNVESYLRYSGSNDMYNPPTNYTFNRLTGVAWGINTTVTCTNTSAFTIEETNVVVGSFGSQVRIYNVTGPEYHFVFATTDTVGQPYAFMVYSNLSAYEGGINDLTKPTDWMNLVLATADNRVVYICSVTAEQYLASVEVAGVAGSVTYQPLGFTKDVSGPMLSQTVVKFLYDMLSQRIGRGVGGAIFDGDTDARGGLYSKTLSAASRMFMTVQKQHYERASASIPNEHLDQTYFVLEYSLQRVGGGSAWLLVFPSLFVVLSIVAAIVFAAPIQTAVLDVTDPVAVAIVMIGSAVPELRGRCSGNSTVLGRNILDGLNLTLRTRNKDNVEFTTDASAPVPELDRAYPGGSVSR